MVTVVESNLTASLFIACSYNFVFITIIDMPLNICWGWLYVHLGSQTAISSTASIVNMQSQKGSICHRKKMFRYTKIHAINSTYTWLYLFLYQQYAQTLAMFQYCQPLQLKTQRSLSQLVVGIFVWTSDNPEKDNRPRKDTGLGPFPIAIVHFNGQLF